MYPREITGIQKIVALFGAALMVFFVSASPSVWADQIVNRPLSNQEMDDYELPEGTQKSNGLYNVAVGVPILLEAQVAIETIITGEVVWELTSQPVDSTAVLEVSPLDNSPWEIPVYDLADQTVYQVAGRKLLLPLVKGIYLVTATVPTDTGEIILTQRFTAATYMGVGILGDVENPKPGQCALCHRDKALGGENDGTGWIGTKHATKLSRNINGINDPFDDDPSNDALGFYRESCNQCHTLGWDEAEAADNNGFDDVRDLVGWTVPETLQEGNWEAIPQELKEVSNIQCESCHGPGSEHFNGSTEAGGSLFNPPSISMSTGVCGQCHDDLATHPRIVEWNRSAHATPPRSPTGERRETCAVCHSGVGFIERIDKGINLAEEPNYRDKITKTDYQPFTCAVCHDPHDKTNPHQLRRVGDVTLMDGETVVTKGGRGKLCMNCHISRRDADTYVLGTSSRLDPHNGPQTDMLVGANAIEYGKEIGSSGHINAVPDTCVTCHMQTVDREDPASTMAGGHTWIPSWDGGTPDDHADDVDLTGACSVCHGEIESFNFKQEDFNEDGFVEGVQDEVEALMHELAMKLPPIGEPTVASRVTTPPHTLAQKKARYNYIFVERDGSQGIHNLSYTVGILKASLEDIDRPGNFFGSGEINGFPGWRSSPWYGNYNVDNYPWIYHDDHSWQFVSEFSSENAIFLFDLGLGEWLYLSSDTYRWMYMFGENPGWIWAFSDNPPGIRIFQRFDDGSLFSVPKL